jgi:small neutral amino acid transporter SnatA (MarC family)
VPFIKSILMDTAVLFPLIDPIASSILVNPLLTGLTNPERVAAAKKVTLYCLAICLVTIIGG